MRRWRQGHGADAAWCADARWGFAGGGPPLIAFTLGCSSLEVSYIGTGSDQFGRTLGYTYTYGCQDGSERQTGSVLNIQYNSLGQALGWDYTVNGQRQTGSVLNIQYNSLGQALGWDYTVNGQSCGHVTRTP